jgi:hypothetical protein
MSKEPLPVIPYGASAMEWREAIAAMRERIVELEARIDEIERRENANIHTAAAIGQMSKK